MPSRGMPALPDDATFGSLYEVEDGAGVLIIGEHFLDDAAGVVDIVAVVVEDGVYPLDGVYLFDRESAATQADYVDAFII